MARKNRHKKTDAREGASVCTLHSSDSRSGDKIMFLKTGKIARAYNNGAYPLIHFVSYRTNVQIFGLIVHESNMNADCDAIASKKYNRNNIILPQNLLKSQAFSALRRNSTRSKSLKIAGIAYFVFYMQYKKSKTKK